MKTLIKKITSFNSDNCLKIILPIVFGMIGSLIIMTIVPPKKLNIVTINITGIVNEFIRNEASKNFTRDELMAHTKLFSKKLEASLNKYAQKKNLIIMPREAIISGANDITPFVENDIKQVINEISNKKANSNRN